MPLSQVIGVQWVAPEIEEFMRNNGIGSRHDLSREPETPPKSTVYTTFNSDWSGIPNNQMLGFLAARMGLDLGPFLTPMVRLQSPAPSIRPLLGGGRNSCSPTDAIAAMRSTTPISGNPHGFVHAAGFSPLGPTTRRSVRHG